MILVAFNMGLAEDNDTMTAMSMKMAVRLVAAKTIANMTR